MLFRKQTAYEYWSEAIQRQNEQAARRAALQAAYEAQLAQQENQDRALMSQLIEMVLDSVARFIGRPTFRFIDVPNFKNASAPMCSLGVLRFDLLWLCRAVYHVYGLWAVVAIVLHETGHTLDCRYIHNSWNVEHYADRKAGWLAGRLGFKNDDVSRFYLCEMRTGPTHPPAITRALNFESGFAEGARLRQYRVFLGLEL